MQVITVSFDMERSADKCEQRRVEHDSAVAIERHVHRDQSLQPLHPAAA